MYLLTPQQRREHREMVIGVQAGEQSSGVMVHAKLIYSGQLCVRACVRAGCVRDASRFNLPCPGLVVVRLTPPTGGCCTTVCLVLYG
jgi:hypothetical protein